MIIHHINSRDDPKVASYLNIRDRDTLGMDGRPGQFIGESPVVVQAMLHSVHKTESVLVLDRLLPRAQEMVRTAERAHGACETETNTLAPWSSPEILVAPAEVLDATVGFNIHRGFLAVGQRPPVRSVSSLIPSADTNGLLLFVEEVNNIDNIGQLFRNAAAFGCHGVVLSAGCHDPLYRKSLRVSCGCALTVPFAFSQDWQGDLHAARQADFVVLGATGGGEHTLQEAARLCATVGASELNIQPRETLRTLYPSTTTPRPQWQRIAVVVGAEFSGLCPETLAACSMRVKIPMASGVDSLNVGVAAGVFLARLTER